LRKKYGDFWYEIFFNSYHINNTKENTLKNPTKMKELKSIYDTKWLSEHFVNYIKRIETITYNYEYMVKEERERKMINKIMQKQQHEAEDIIDYTTFGKNKAITSNYEIDLNQSRIIKEKNSEYNIYGSQNKPFRIVNSNSQDWCKEEPSEESPKENYTDDNDNGYESYESDDDPFGSESDSDSEAEVF